MASDDGGAKAFFNQAEAKRQETERAQADRLRQRHTQIKRSIKRLHSGKANVPPLRDPTLDEQIFKGIKAALDDNDIVRITARGGGTVTDYRSRDRRIRTKIQDPNKVTEETKESVFWTPTWDHAGDLMKALAWGCFLEGKDAQSMTMHLSDEVIKGAGKDPKGFAPHMRGRLTRYLKAALASYGLSSVDFFFAVEAAYGIEPHLHGAILIPNDPDIIAATDQALKKACGNWRGKVRQVKLEPFYSPVKWVRYISKWRRGTVIQIGDQRIIACTNGLRSAAKAWYREARSSGAVIF